jgi:four helix bundle protein
MDLVKHVYEFTASLPMTERYGLSSQLQRAAVSIASNVAEGHCRRTRGAYINHVSIAIGSVAEIETLIAACRMLNVGDSALLDICSACASETGKMLYGLHRSLVRAQRALYSGVLLVPACWYALGSLF